jgi:hypothetical protein
VEIRGAVRENRLSDPTRVTAADILWFVEHGPIWVFDAAGRIAGFAAGDRATARSGPCSLTRRTKERASGKLC